MHFQHGIPVIWITGLPGSGKTTLGLAIADFLRDELDGPRTQILDGDEIRKDFWPELGYSEEERQANVLRTARLARMLVGHRVLPIVCLVSPNAQARKMARDLVGYMSEIYLWAPIDLILKRRPSFYRIPYDIPQSPQFVFDTSEHSPEEILGRIFEEIW